MSDLALLEAAAREAGEIARRFWRADPEVWDKGGNDPVTEADLAVDRHLKDRLLKARSDYAWLSEETEDDLARLEAERVFIVDPIDGTRAFVAGEPTWAHSIAVAEAGRITAACVYLPVSDKLYLAGRSNGATLNGDVIAVSDTQALTGATVLSPKVNFQAEHWKGGPPAIERHFRPSLAYRMSLVGEGRFDAMITLRDAWEWDIAAGALIAEEAGAVVSDRKSAPLAFNGPTRKCPGVLVAGRALHGAMMERLA